MKLQNPLQREGSRPKSRSLWKSPTGSTSDKVIVCSRKQVLGLLTEVLKCFKNHLNVFTAFAKHFCRHLWEKTTSMSQIMCRFFFKNQRSLKFCVNMHSKFDAEFETSMWCFVNRAALWIMSKIFKWNVILFQKLLKSITKNPRVGHKGPSKGTIATSRMASPNSTGPVDFASQQDWFTSLCWRPQFLFVLTKSLSKKWLGLPLDLCGRFGGWGWQWNLEEKI